MQASSEPSSPPSQPSRVLTGLCAMLLSLTGSSTRGSFSLFNGIAVVTLLLVGIGYIYNALSPTLSGGMELAVLGKILSGPARPWPLRSDAQPLHEQFL